MNRKKVSRRRTELEMRKALANIADPTLVDRDDDPPSDVFADIVQELIEARNLIEEIDWFIQGIRPKLAKR